MKQTKKLLTSAVLMMVANQSLAYSFVGRWFEVEVILLSQLGDKSNIQEVFETNKVLPKYKRHIELLESYLSPDIASLKNQLPQCGERGWLLDSYQDALKPTPYYEVKTLEQIEQERLARVVESPELSDDFPDIAEGNESQVISSDQLPLAIITNTPADVLSNSADDTTEIEVEVEEQVLTAEQLEYLEQAKTMLSDYQFTLLDDLYYQQMCVLSEQKYQDIVSDDLTDYNKVIHHSMDRIVNGAPFEQSNVPYIIDKDAFQLTDIYKQLRRSREFRPLMHIAWRQPVYRVKQATPVRLYAGEHLAQRYQEQLSLYQEQQELLAEQEATIAALVGENNVENLSNEQVNQSQEIRTSKLLNIINNADTYPDDVEQLLAQTEQNNQLYYSLLSQTEEMTVGPTEPIQPWFLDGFFRLHLHRNYLNITADFNILGKTVAEYESEALLPNAQQTEFETINFSQKRRIISKEIHYFDHPHMGMIVQVRRYNKPEPDIE